MVKALPLVLPRALPYAGKRFDCAEKHQAEPEVHQHAQVEMRGIVPRGGRQVRH